MIQSMSYDKLNQQYHRLLKLVKRARKIIITGNNPSICNDAELQTKYKEICLNFVKETEGFDNV